MLSADYKWISSFQDQNLAEKYKNHPFIKMKYISTQNFLVKVELQGRVFQIPESQTADASYSSNSFDDMCQMSILNQAEILHNIQSRFLKRQIFTNIGTTLVVVNPYEKIEQLFNSKVLEKYQKTILASKSDSNKQLENLMQEPHIYSLSTNAYYQMKKTSQKQTIIISGESGAGKTQSTKYCLQLITSLSSHSPNKNEATIQEKILSCNPILQAFGNSKTVRNDNSSRFGKYIQIFFSKDQKNPETRIIEGANINSYLLEKSRVVSVEKGERNYHCFYALVAAGSKNMLSAKEYYYLKQSGCYQAKNIEDQANFYQINQAFAKIGFKKQQVQHIWKILKAILDMGNLQFNDKQHRANQSSPCKIQNPQILDQLASMLNIKLEFLQQFLLFEKKKFLKQTLLSPYSLAGCRANLDSLSKELYSQVFDFILLTINKSIKPPSQKTATNKSGKGCSPTTINILDIFGFENFDKNSFEQMCINFTNEKLLNLYNQYVFQKQLTILRQDGLAQQILGMDSPNNQQIISLLCQSKGVSIFSLINDLTPHNQYSDMDLIMSFKKQLASKNKKISFSKHNNQNFSIEHSQCQVSYNIQNFKEKNKDKVKNQIYTITEQLFPSLKSKNEKKQGKTLLSKFTIEIEGLMRELESSKVHFIRCLKPNNQKKQRLVEGVYLLNQIRYLGVFQTIKIRKNNFPSRLTHEQFIMKFIDLFQRNQTIQEFLKKKERQFCKQKKAGSVVGKKRVYLSLSLDQSLSKEIEVIRRIKITSAKKILRQYKVFRFRKTILKNLKGIKKKIQILKKASHKNYLQTQRHCLKRIIEYSAHVKLKLQKQKQKKLQEQENQKQFKKLQNRKNKIQQFKRDIPAFSNALAKFIVLCMCSQGMSSIKNYAYSKVLQQYRTNAQPQQLKRSQSVASIVPQDQTPYQRNVQATKKQKSLTFPKKFVNYNSVQRGNEKQQILFKYNLKIALLNQKQDGDKLKILLQTINAKEETKAPQNIVLVDSTYLTFTTNQVDNETYQQLMNFSQEQFCKLYLRKRSKYLVVKHKTFNQIFTAKKKPLQRSLTKLSKQHETFALRVFRQILKCNYEGNTEFLLKVIEVFITMCSDCSQQVVNEIYLQIMKQIHTPIQNNCLNAYRLMLIFIHYFRPDEVFLKAGLYLLLQRIECHCYSSFQENSLRVLYKKTYRKYKNLTITQYVPSKYQLYCLICKKVFPIKFYLSAGNHVQIFVESDQTLREVKEQILEKMGINTKRISPRFFCICQVVSFENAQMDQNPLSQGELVWDAKSYWEIAVAKYLDLKCEPPKFYFLIKLKIPFELQPFDLEGIQIVFSQCFFEYFTGKIRVSQEYLDELALLIIKIKEIDIFSEDNFVFGVYPLWSMKGRNLKNSIEKLRTRVKNSSDMEDLQYYQLKYQFIKILEKHPLAMSFSIPSDSQILGESSLLYFLKPRRLYVVQKESMKILEQYQLKKITEWSVDSEKISFKIKDKGDAKAKTHVLFTEYAQIFSEYLEDIGILTEQS